MERNRTIWIAVLVIFTVIAGALIYYDWRLSGATMGDYLLTPMMGKEYTDESIRYSKNMDIWFMLYLIAFLMMFIRKFESGTSLAVILSTAASFIVYMFIQQFFFGQEIWDQTLMIRGVVCAITVVIAIGVFLGLCKMWQYLLVGALFAPSYILVEYFLANEFFGFVATDAGGSILVHMCAAYFGIGVAVALREKRSFDEPMESAPYTMPIVWLAAVLLWMLWPSFLTALMTPDQAIWAMITCYMSGLGSMISAYFACMIFQKKVNPLVYAYAMLGGPVAIGSNVLSVGPWGALFIGLVAGVVVTWAFIYLQPWICKKMGVVDMMGVHNLHGVGGWVATVAICIITMSIDNVIFVLGMMAITLGTGAITGLIVRATRGKMDVLVDDDTDFIRIVEPESE